MIHIARQLLPSLRSFTNAASTVITLNRAFTTKPEEDDRNKKTQQAIVLNEEDIEEKHVRGWGNGGQKLNKTSSCVQLLHKPTNIMVICQDTRYLQQNRKIARKRLMDKLDLLFNGENSKTGQKIRKLQARKHKNRQRAKKKYSSKEEAEDNQHD